MLGGSVLEREIVQRFVDRLCDTVHYNVNVMNTDGIIIAARDQHRKGVQNEAGRQSGESESGACGAGVVA